MKRILFLLMLLWSVTAMYAQSSIFECSREAKSDRAEGMNGKHGFLIISAHKDVVIRVISAVKDVPDPVVTKGKEEGTYEYMVVLDADESMIPKIEVSRRGNVYKTEFTVERLKPDYLIAYRLEETKQPIRLDDTTESNDMLPNEKAAELEFTTSISDLTVVLNPALEAQITKSKKSNDKSINIISAIIPIQKIKDARESWESKDAELKALDERLQNNPDKATDSDWERLDQLEAETHKAEAYYQELCLVDIYADQTNHLSIDISDLTPRAKKCYAVLPLVVETEIFKTECSAHMNEAAKLFEKFRYDEAKIEYQNALASKDVLDNMKANIRHAIADCDTCSKYNNMTVAAFRRIKELKESGTATQKQLAEYAVAAIYSLEKLNNFNPDEFYSSRIEKLEKLVDNIPVEFSFTVVEWKTLMEGNPIQNVEVWLYYGEKPLPNMTFTSERQFKKAIDAEKGKFTQVGVTNERGKVVVDMPRNNLPSAIVFNPVKKENAKIKALSTNELMRESSGTYMKRQFRLRLYTKQ